MTTDWKALCAELVAWAEKTSSNYYKQADVLLRARAALAEQPVMPTDEELLHVAAISIEPYESSGIATGEYEPETECAVEVYGSELIAYARAVLARWGNPAATPVPEPGEVAELVDGLMQISDGMSALGHESDSWFVARAATLLGQQQAAPATVPVPVPVAPAEDLAARPLLEQMARLQHSHHYNPWVQLLTLSSRAAAWLRENPPGQPVAIEPRGCPTPGACSCVEPAAAPVPEPGEVAELVVELRMMASQAAEACQFTDAENLSRAADLLQRLSPPQPVPVSERLPKPKDCDAEGRCWLGGCQLGNGTPTWLLGYPAWAERFPEVHRFWLPFHALPLPEQEMSK